MNKPEDRYAVAQAWIILIFVLSIAIVVLATSTKSALPESESFQATDPLEGAPVE